MKDEQKGVSVILVILVLLIISVVSLLGINKLPQLASVRENIPGLAKCEGSKSVKLTNSPLDLDDLNMIGPMGLMLGAHVIPSDHLGFAPIQGRGPHKVYAPADGTVKSIQTRTVQLETGKTQKAEYHIKISHNCGFYTKFDLINTLSPKLTSVLNKNADYTNNINLPIKAGDLIGTLDDDGHGLDFWAVDETITLPGLLNPARFTRDQTLLHVIDPFPLFTEPLRSELSKKAMRPVEPQGGKIDYDIEGKLVGNWFGEGFDDRDPQFWLKQLAISYHALDPEAVVVSIGDWKGEPTQFAILGNKPDPKDVSVETGLVKYELYEANLVHSDGSSWDFTKFANDLKFRSVNQAQGVILVQLIESRRLKVETFVGKTAEQVTGFTSRALIYER